MRFLIVDDDPEKIELVKHFLLQAGGGEVDIETAEHAAAARLALSKRSFDVLLVDVLLPVRKGAQPQGENSVELLRQIVEDGTTRSPGHILAMTASQEALAAFRAEFGSLVTQVLHVAPGEDSWREALAALLLLLRRIDDARDTNDYDICVLNALRTPELDAVLSTWPLRLQHGKVISRNIVCRSGTVGLDGVDRRIVCAHLPQMGPIAATHAATVLLGEFRPRVLLMTGVCGGFSDHVKIGDVVVADKSWDWQAGKWTDGGMLAISPDQKDGAPELVAEARGIEAFLAAAHAAHKGQRPESPPKVIAGPMVTGSSVVASLDIQKVFRLQHRKMAGIDMECYGLYYAAENHAGENVRVLCVKAVSDLADRGKTDDFQGYCSEISALAALEVTRRYFSHGTSK